MASSQSSAERQLNLFIALYVARRYVTKAEIRDVIDAYRDKSAEAFDRMFERDKSDLVSIGVHIETGSNDAFFDDELGYRIRPESVELDGIDLSPEEAALVGVAHRVWNDGGRASKTLAGLRKLELGGLDVDGEGINTFVPQISAADPAFDAVLDALRDRRYLQFGYTKMRGEHTRRQIQPWHLFHHADRWYVLGLDLDREAPRVFRLSRMDTEGGGIPQATGDPGSYRIPEDLDLRSLTSSIFDGDPIGVATIRVRQGRGLALRRRATATHATGDDFDELSVPYVSVGSIASDIAGLGDDAVALAPDEVRDVVIGLLQVSAS